VTGDLSPLVKVSSFTSLLNTAEVNPHARLTAVIATCLSVVKSNDILATRDPIRPLHLKSSVSRCVTDRELSSITLVVKRLSSLPSKQGAGVRLPPSVLFFSPLSIWFAEL
jgi:hypothetical protein